MEAAGLLYLEHPTSNLICSGMDDRTTEAALSLTKFGIGQPVRRSEDPKLVRGEGPYTDDIGLAGQAYAVMVRSSEPHGVIRGIDTAAAKAMPGVLAVLTGEDLKAYGGLKCNLPLKNRDGSPIKYKPRPALASDKVRFVGDPVACVVAETIAQAKDAAEAVVLDIEPLPAVVSARDAAKPGAPLLWDEAPGNIALDYHYGDKDKVAEAFAKAAHVVRLPLVNQRLVVNSIEPRSAIGEYERGAEKWTLHSCSQGVFGLKNMLRDILGAPADKVRVLTGNVGGSFGMKAAVYPEYVCILHAARALGRPVKWTDERSGSFVSDHHGRDYDMTVEVAFDKDGLIQARAAYRLRQSGRLLLSVRPAAADRQRDQEHRQHVPHAAARSRDPMRVHQHHAGLGLSRRRAAGRRVQHGADDGLRRRRTRHRPVRAAQAQFHQGHARCHSTPPRA